MAQSLAKKPLGGHVGARLRRLRSRLALRRQRLVARLAGPTVTIGKLIATALGAGYSPIAPGTCGALLAVPLAFVLAPSGRLVLTFATVAVFGIGVWAADVAGEAWGTEDDQRIVIDEVAGYLITILPLDPRHAVDVIFAFLLFRLLDSWKPGPIRTLDERIHGGLGVMLDDVAAGLLGALLLGVAKHYGLLERVAHRF